MRKLLRKRKKLILLLMLAFFSLFLMTVDFKDKRSFFFLDSIIVSAFSPVQAFINRSIDKLNRILDSYVSSLNVKEENILLKDEIEKLKAEKSRFLEIEKQYSRLLQLLDFKKNFSSKMLLAEVISNDLNSWFKIIVVNKGANSGIKKGMAVVSTDGLIGRTVEVNSNTSKVLLLTDFRSAVDALIQRTRDRGVIKGKNTNTFEMKYIPLNADIKVNDRVISSGLGGVFPKGFLIGTVSRIKKKKQSLFQEAEVVPDRDLSEIEEVFIIIEK